MVKWGRRGLLALQIAWALLSSVGWAHATEPAPGRKASPEFFARAGAEWGILSAPVATQGSYRSPDGSTSLQFHEIDADRELIAGRLELGGAFASPHGGTGVISRGQLTIGCSPAELRSLTVAGVPIEYVSQPMYASFGAGIELQFAERVIGVGLDVGWAGTWSPGRPASPLQLELSRHTSSGPWARASVTVRLPWSTRYGVGFVAAFEGYVVRTDWVGLGTESRTSLGAFLEWDNSR